MALVWLYFDYFRRFWPVCEESEMNFSPSPTFLNQTIGKKLSYYFHVDSKYIVKDLNSFMEAVC